MIQEEVEHADRIITQVMGYAQLSEGHVEKLDVIEELNYAIERVFPPAADYPITVQRDYAGDLSAPGHAAAATLPRLHQCAAERPRSPRRTTAGNVCVSARCTDDYSVEVSIRG